MDNVVDGTFEIL